LSFFIFLANVPLKYTLDRQYPEEKLGRIFGRHLIDAVILFQELMICLTIANLLSVVINVSFSAMTLTIFFNFYVRYLIPCQHILASQRRSIRDVDIYNASASRFLALTPAVCASEAPKKDDDILQPVQLNQETKPEVSFLFYFLT